MRRILLLLFFCSVCFGKPPEWVEIPEQASSHFKIYRSFSTGRNKWVGFPDPNYSWEGERLVWERTVIEDGNEVTVKTYKKPYEIVASLKLGSKVFGVDNKGVIESAAVRKFGGSLKGFVWLDKAYGRGEVILPFIAEHIFIARGDRFNPVLTEIGTYTSSDNYYTTFEGKTHVFVSSFSGIGGAAGIPSTLIAHYKLNENTANDNDELVTNGTAPADLTGWTQQPGTQWSIVGNKFQGAGNSANNYLYQDFGAVLERKYKFSYEVTDNSLVGGTTANQLGLSDAGSFGSTVLSSSVATHTYYLTATVEAVTNKQLRLILIKNATGGTIDIDNISIQLLAVEDSSGNSHDMLMQQDTDAISVAGKINTAFDFNGSSDYGEIADHDDFTPALTPFSISAWVYMHDATHFRIVSKGVYNTDGEFDLRIGGADQISWSIFDEDVDDCYIGRYVNSAITSYQNQWIHLVAVYDGGIVSSGLGLYLNAVKVDDRDLESNAGSFVAVENLDHAVWIGRYGTVYANGLIDNVMFFSKELDSGEVGFLYNGSGGREGWDKSTYRGRYSGFYRQPYRNRYLFE